MAGDRSDLVSAAPSGKGGHPPPEQARDNFAVVGIGASAGGLDACRKLLAALPVPSGMAFIVIQHLDPTHESMMVDLLASHTAMTVRQAEDGMRLERDHVYAIPPGSYLAVGDGALHLSQPKARHGTRLPFDFLLHSLAEAHGPRAICVILSGTGADGSLGLKSVKEKGGFVIAQDPAEAAFDGMPQSAIKTGAVDRVLTLADIPAALVAYAGRAGRAGVPASPRSDGIAPERLAEVVALLRTRAGHDFTHYKQGTLQRRIERRMAMAGIEAGAIGRYLDILLTDAGELDLLAKDLLIHVTGFFRDPEVFQVLAEKVIPGMLEDRRADQPLRIWDAGCSSGEETYSLAMLFREAIAASGRDIRLQIFASDIDPEAVASAREGLYPETIEAEVSPERLARFFVREDHGYRVSPELRADIVFTVQDLLSDPPFSRLDMVACRNLLIYLQPEAQAKVISLFHFALRQGGILLLGSAEAVGDADHHFEPIAKAQRIFRHTTRSRPGEVVFPVGADASLVRLLPRGGAGDSPTRLTALAELCRRMVIGTYAPATVLINQRHECLYSLGPTDRYLRLAPGHPSNDVLAMARRTVAIRLRSAIQQARQAKRRIVVPGGWVKHDGVTSAYSIDVQPTTFEGEDLLLICFADQPQVQPSQEDHVAPHDASRVAELERELQTARTALEGAVRDLELAGEQQKAISDEALSVSEEYQSANEELLTSKEELQSLNEELTALNSQLQETLEQQRTTANDLQNVLNSTDIATLFLDTELRIRLFTPATRSLFNVIEGDVGRPLSDLKSLSADDLLLADARAVLQGLEPGEREVEAQDGVWFLRRILPYRTQAGQVEGVVITFTDVTDRKQTARALEAATRQAEAANIVKSRFLAAASHDLRQPLQTLSLLQGLLTRAVDGEKEKEQKLLARLGETVDAMSGMLNTLLDINQIEAGTVQANPVAFPVNDLIVRLRDEFAYAAQAQGITLRAVPCGLWILSDPRLLEQMLRNLLSNALKYTERGKVLLGCRRRQGGVSIEVWDTGEGIRAEELQAIFEEYYQVGNAARMRSRGVGLGLAIVQHLGRLLGHRVSVRSHHGKGSVFAIEVARRADDAPGRSEVERRNDAVVGDQAGDQAGTRTGTILLVEDDPDVRELLRLILEGEGHHVTTAADGITALASVREGTTGPDLVLADYNLPSGQNGLEMAEALRKKLGHKVPIIILTGDISTAALRDIAAGDCVHLSKPVKPKELAAAIQRILQTARAETRTRAPSPDGADRPPSTVIYVVDDDRSIREGLRSMLEDAGFAVEDFGDGESFFAAYRPGRDACLLIDALLPGMSGIEVLQRLRADGERLPALMITGSGDVKMAVEAMKAGASDFVEKPARRKTLLAGIERALLQSRDAGRQRARGEAAASRLAGLTPRQRAIMDRVLAGEPSKNIAADLGISQRTVENHRAAIMKRTGVKSLPALARLAMAAASRSAPPPHDGPPGTDRPSGGW